MALDGHGEPLDIPGSNMGHLLGTGILDARRARLVAAGCSARSMFSGYGMHTISRRAAGFWPFSYHCGSVWSHDTAIAIRGLLAEGFLAEARTLAEGLLTAGRLFGNRLPELFAGVPADRVRPRGALSGGLPSAGVVLGVGRGDRPGPGRPGLTPARRRPARRDLATTRRGLAATGLRPDSRARSRGCYRAVASGVYLKDFRVTLPPVVAALTVCCPSRGNTSEVRVCSPPLTNTSTEE